LDFGARSRGITKVLWQILVLNWGVALAKVIFGSVTNSMSIMADGFHSFADGSSNIVGIVGMRFAGKPQDEDHPYGHKKYETIAATAIGIMLLTVGVGILKTAVERFQNPVEPQVDAMSFIVMMLTVGVNLFVIWYENGEGKRLKSDILTSDSYHTRSDVYVSLSVILSLVGVKMGFHAVDAIASMVIAVVIGRAAYQILSGCIGTLVDESRVNPELVRDISLTVPGVVSCHKIRSRGQEDAAMVDLHIQVPRTMTVEQSHHIVHELQNKIRREIPAVLDVVVHTEPMRDSDV
jgi:cation diffusion facilitator family transporter